MSLSCPLNTTKYPANLSIYVRIISMGIVELGLINLNYNALTTNHVILSTDLVKISSRD